MAALTAARNTPHMGDSAFLHLLKLPMKASTVVFAGSLAVIDAGYAAPGRTALSLIAAGRVEKTIDNSTGIAGAKTCEVRRGVFGFNNSTAGDLIAQANVGALCYIVDDNTVALTNGTSTRSIAGRIVSVSEGDSMVYVEVGSFNP
jgi:hypothetical protein